MGRVFKVAFLCSPLAFGLACIGLTGQSPAQAEPADANPFAERLLEAHNDERDRIGVPRLRWSAKLASEAEDWAAHLATKGRMIHADPQRRKGAGENLWMGSKGYYGAETMVAGFLGEKHHFQHRAFPEVSRNGNWLDVGHYTQVIWRNTQEVGCAVARGQRDDFLVCRYYPAGNVWGQKVY